MDNLSIIGVLGLWVQSQNLNVKNLVYLGLNPSHNLSQSIAVTHSLSLSSVVFFICAASCVKMKNGCFLVAFLFCELYVNLVQLPEGYEYRFYFGCAFIYCVLYWLLIKQKRTLKTRLSCGIMVLFELRMCIDAIVNSEVETIIYSNYEYIVLFIHILIISTLLPWQRIRLRMGNIARALHNKFRYSDVVAYICYNCQTQTK